MGFLIHGFSLVLLRPGRAVKLYVSVLVELYTVFSVRKNPGPKPLSKIWPKICPKIWAKIRARQPCIKNQTVIYLETV